MSKIFSQIDLSKLFQPKYIFESMPATNGLYLYLAALFGIFIVLAVVFIYLYRKPKYQIYRRLRSSLFNFFLTCGLIGLGITGARSQQITFLGSRLAMILLFLVIIVWGASILYFKFVIMPKVINKEKAKEKFSRYLPKNERNK